MINRIEVLRVIRDNIESVGDDVVDWLVVGSPKKISPVSSKKASPAPVSPVSSIPISEEEYEGEFVEI